MSWIDDWRGQARRDLAARFEEWGARDAEAWARSELEEDIAQSARFLFLRAVWRRMNDHVDWAMRDPAIVSLLADGVAAEEVAGVIRRCLYTYTFDVLFLIDEPGGTLHSAEPRTDLGPTDPRWVLMEASPKGELTGRDVGGLHESLLEEDFAGPEVERWL